MKDLKGRLALLPNGQKVKIENVRDGFATVLRLSAPRSGKIALCGVESLTLSEEPRGQQRDLTKPGKLR
jgi:hypothetical protein